MTPPSKPAILPLRVMFLVAALIFLLIVLLRSAWVSDDAYITFRVIDNFLSGHGLRWNADERVQVFTDPLFVALGILAGFVSGNLYLATIAVSLALALTTFLVITRGAGEIGIAIAITLLIFSKGFIDYSISGMENPLTDLLVAVFLSAWWRRRSVFVLSLIAALAAVNRMDTLILFLPALGVTYFRKRRGIWKPLLIAWSPLLAWCAFALIYYGFLFPNTAYAKLHTGIAERELIFQGILYYVNALTHDTVTLFVIAGGLAVACLVREYAVALSVFLYLFYILWVGGDFMSSRFFTAPFMVCVMLILRYWTPSFAPALAALASVAALGMWIPCPTLTSATPDFRLARVEDIAGISDERAAYYPSSGLARYRRGVIWPDLPSSQLGHDLRLQHLKTYIWPQIGAFGYQIGPETHVIDPMGLGDALLARLPVGSDQTWRIGHFPRNVPAGYEETLQTGVNKVADAGIAAYYEHLKVIISGDLWSWNRFREIVLLNAGAYESLLPRARARTK